MINIEDKRVPHQFRNKYLQRTAGGVYSAAQPSAASVDLSSKLDKSVWAANFEELTDSNGNEYLYLSKPIVMAAGATMYAGNDILIPSIFEGLPLDQTTIGWMDGKLSVLGNIGGGISSAPVTGAGNAITSASLSDDGKILSLFKGATFLTEHQSLVDYAKKTDIPSLTGYATESWVNNKGYLIATSQDKLNWNAAFGWGNHTSAGYAKTSDLANYVTLATDQEITGAKTFTADSTAFKGITIGGVSVKKSEDGVLILDGNLLVTGCVTMHALGSRTAATIMDGVLVDGTTIIKENGKLVVVGGSGGGLDTARMWAELGSAGSEQIASNHLTTALGGCVKKTGDVMTGELSFGDSNRRIRLGVGYITQQIFDTNGGWAQSYGFNSSNNSLFAEFGAHGINQTLAYAYVGSSYDGSANTWQSWNKNGSTIRTGLSVSGALTAEGYTVWHAANLPKSSLWTGSTRTNHGSIASAYSGQTFIDNFLNNTFAGTASRGSWSYAANGYVTTDFGNIHLAGTAYAAWGYSHIRSLLFITPSTAAVASPLLNEMLFYTSNSTDNSYPKGWTRVLTNRNYNLYSPTLTGGGATGIWSINIHGNSYATRLASVNNLNNVVDYGLSTLTAFQAWNSIVPNAPCEYPYGLTIRPVDGAYGMQLVTGAFSNNLYLRKYNSNTYGGWNQLWSNDNWLEQRRILFENEQLLDLRYGYDPNKWYPCWFNCSAYSGSGTRLVILNGLRGNKPAWGTHASGFSIYLDATFTGAGWGTISNISACTEYTAQFGGETALGGVEQNTMASDQIIWLRGGAIYYYWLNNGKTIQSSPSGYSWSSAGYSYAAVPKSEQGSPASGFKQWGVAYTNGNINSATKLQNMRTIWGQSFDGTQNVDGTIVANNGIKSRNICIETNSNGAGYSNSSEINNFTSHLYLQYATANNLLLCNGGGSVGIGVATPGYRLHVNGNGYFSSNVTSPQVNYIGSFGANYICHGNGDTATYTNHNLIIRSWYGIGIRGNDDICRLVINARTGTVSSKGIFQNERNIDIPDTWVGILRNNAMFDSNTVTIPAYYANTFARWGETIRNVGYTTTYVIGSRRDAMGYGEMRFWVSGDDSMGGANTGHFLSLGATGHMSWSGSASATRLMAGYDSGQVGAVSCNNWFRSNGNTGWYSDTHGGGIHMLDSSYVRVFGNKRFYCENASADCINANGGLYSNGVNGHGLTIIGDESTTTRIRGRIGSGLNNAVNSYEVQWYHNYFRMNVHRGGSSDISKLSYSYNNNEIAYLTMGGNFLLTGGSTMHGSDITKKDVIEHIQLSLYKIANAPLIRYRWKDNRNTCINVGGSAQYTNSLLPECAYEVGGAWSMDYATTAYAFAVSTAKHFLDYIKKQSTKEDERDKEIRKLKQRIKVLERRAK